MDARSLLSVAGGGVIGAAARWATFEVLDHELGALVTVNAVGAFILGALIGAQRGAPSRSRLWLGVGFCGALTTFSTLAFEVAVRLDDGRVMAAAATLLVTTATGVVAGVAGNRALKPGGPR